MICGYVVVTCANGCKERVIRDKIFSHQTKECLLRKHTCEHCRAIGTYLDITGSHLNQCPDFAIPCSNRGCELKIKRKDMTSHRSVCPAEIIGCPYAGTGCTFKSERDKMAQHKATSCEYHLDLAMKQLVKQSENQVELMKTILTLEQEKPHWITMTNYKDFKERKKEWYSEEFYTHLYGYNLCLRVDANGHDEGEGKYVSVYLCVVEGLYDDSLKWPMQCESAVTLLNQLRDGDHHTGNFILSVEHMNEPKSCALVGERGRRRGYHRFIAHHQLDQSRLGRSQYLKDDKLCFKIQVKVLIH